MGALELSPDAETLLQYVLREVRAARKEIAELKATISRDKIYDTWIDEPVAAKTCRYAPRTFRTMCIGTKKKDGTHVAPTLSINWRRNPTGKGYQYNKRDLTKYLQNTSTFIA